MFSQRKREEYDRTLDRATYSAANGAGIGRPLMNGYATKPFEVIPLDFVCRGCESGYERKLTHRHVSPSAPKLNFRSNQSDKFEFGMG